jgi:hypothetical protein
LSGGQAEIDLSGTWLDVTGNVAFSGFNSVRLAADRDMTFTDAVYGSQYAGLLSVSGDLTLQAARLYPTTLSNFTIDTTNAAAPYGKVTVLPSGLSTSGPIYSAGGSLTIKAAGGYRNGVEYGGIDQEGYIAAPMGSISLQSPNGRVYLGSGSTTTTKGDAAAAYGSIESGYNQSDLGVDAWVVSQHTGSAGATLVQGAPAGSISLKATNGEVIVRDGAFIDVSGGGTVFASLFVPSYSGTNNPLTGSYVVIPGNSVTLPGSAVYLAGVKGLPAGTYSLLPALDTNGNPTPYVYLPGAMVVTNLGTTIARSTQALTSDGYPIVAGYATTMGTTISSPLYQAYEVRPASVVLAQGNFETQSAVAGNAGSVTIAGNTTILGGAILASALSGYRGGSIVVSGTNSMVVESTSSLPSDFAFSTPVPASLSNTMTIASSALSYKGFQTIGLGVSDLTGSGASVAASTVEVKPCVVLQAENIIAGARTSITLDTGAQVLAIAAPGDTGQVTFISPGVLSVGANAVVHASDAVNLQIASLSLDPAATLKADHSFLNLTGTTITLTGGNEVSTSGLPGLFLTTAQWNSLAGSFDDISLIAVDLSVPSSPRSGTLVFNGLSGADSLAAIRDTLTIDAGLVTTRVNSVDTGSAVTLAAQTIAL